MTHLHSQRPAATRSKVGEPFPSLARLVEQGRASLMSARELRMFFNELEMHGGYQILVSRGERDNGGQVKIFVTYETKV
jgi:hypothetical protein